MISSKTSTITASSIHRRTDVAFASYTTPSVSVYQWSNGFGTKYANPATPTPSDGQRIRFSNSGNTLLFGNYTDPRFDAYSWTVGSGFGSRFATPAAIFTSTGAAPTGIWFSNSDDAVFISAGYPATPRIVAYPWSSNGFGTKYTDISPTPTATVGRSRFHQSQSNIILTMQNASNDNLFAHAWSNGWGSRFTDPVSRSGGSGMQVAIHYLGTIIARTTTVTPFLESWNWSSSGFGSKRSAPANPPTGAGRGCDFTSNGNAFGMYTSVTPFVLAYQYSTSGFGTKYANPASAFQGSTDGDFKFTTDNRYVIASSSTTPFIGAYEWNNGFGTKLANPSTIPAADTLNFDITYLWTIK